MKHTLRSAAAAVAIVALMVLGTLLVGVPTGSGGAAATSSPVASVPLAATPEAIPPAEFAYLTQRDHVPVPLLDRLTNEGVTPAQMQAMFDWESFGVSAAGGCIVGGGLGAIGGGAPGAAVGCAVGAAWAGLANYWGQQDGTSMANSQEFTAISQLLSSMLDQFNLTAAFAATMLSALNQTQYAMSAAADSAALLQLQNSTFNEPLDLIQSPVPYNMLSVVEPIASSVGSILNMTNEWLWASYGPGGSFNTYALAPIAGELPNACGGKGYCTAASLPVVAGGVTGGTVDYYIAHGAIVGNLNWNSVQGTIPNTLTSIDGRGSITISADGTIVWTGPSDIVAPNGPLAGSGVLPITGGGSLAVGTGGAYGSWGYSNTVSTTAYSIAACVTTTSGGCDSYAGTIDPHQLWSESILVVQSIMANAVNNAKAYWTYLRSIGYTSENSVPADCAVPMPAFSLPPSLANDAGNLTVNQTLSLYYAWINSLANFFDAPLNATSFCQGHAIYTGPGTGSWGNLNLTIYGYIYVPGKAWTVNSGLVSSTVPLLSKRSTWTFNGSSPTYGQPTGPGKGNASLPIEMTGWPMLASVSIPIGTVFEVPKNDPLTIIPTAYLTYLTLTGNGTAVSVGASAPLSTSAGDALYITSCTIGGQPQATNCTLSFSTINGVLPNVTCGSPCGYHHQQGGATFGGLPNPFSWLSGLFSGLFGGGSLGNFLGGVAAGLLILAVIAVLVYVAVIEVEAWGGRKRGGGGGGGGGSVVVVRGGR